MVKVTTDKALDFYMNDRYEFNKLYYEDNPIFSPCSGIDWSFNVKDWGKANYFLTTNFYWKVPKLKKYRVTLRINYDYTDECEAMSEEEAEDSELYFLGIAKGLKIAKHELEKLKGGEEIE